MQGFANIYEELLKEISEIPIVDIHQHLNPARLAAKTIEDIVFYHYIVTELASAGMDREEFEKAVHKDRISKALPYFKYVRGTSTFWCLRQILKNIYGIDIKGIDESNWKDVVNAIEGRPRDNAWAYSVLKNVCKVKKSFLTINPLEPLPQYDEEVFTGALRVEHIVQYINRETLQKIEQAAGIDVNDAESLDKALESLFKKFHNKIVAITVPVQPDERFLIPHRNEVTLYVRDLKKRDVLSPEGRTLLSSFILHKLLSLCAEHKKVAQIMLGVKRPVPSAAPPDYAITMYSPDQILNMARLFAMYPELKFDVMTADSTISHQLTVIAKNYPNVCISGYWWYSMYPEIIGSYIRLRLQMLPYNKIGGFFSDAYVVEWVYGKAALVKKVLARVLAEMVFENYIDKELAIDMAKALLYENAIHIYKL
uniref:Glucuronate isomerase n=1 Tax=Ignisphaera aggregans TaxID=334771 RepID=A0A7C2ZVJ9_9CREN